MNNTSGPRVEASQAYGAKIRGTFGFTSRLSRWAFDRCCPGVCWLNKQISAVTNTKKVIDKLAAQLILQNYLDQKILRQREKLCHDLTMTTEEREFGA